MWGSFISYVHNVFRETSTSYFMIHTRTWYIRIVLVLKLFTGWINGVLIQKIRLKQYHCVKIVCIRSFSGPYFLAFGLNKDRYGCGKMQENTDQKIPNTVTFYAVYTIQWKRKALWCNCKMRSLVGLINIFIKLRASLKQNNLVL